MSYTVEYSQQASRDLVRLLAFLSEKDPAAARKALSAIREAARLLEHFPFSCRRAEGVYDPLLREMVISFGNSGYVALFKIRRDNLVTIVAIRHQLEEDYQ